MKVKDNKNAIKIINRVAIVTIVVNLVLAIGKFLAGIFGKSTAMISDAKKDEIITLLDGLYYSFDTQRAKIVRAMWIGLTAVTEKYKPLQSYIKEVKKILETYALI